MTKLTPVSFNNHTRSLKNIEVLFVHGVGSLAVQPGLKQSKAPPHALTKANCYIVLPAEQSQSAAGSDPDFNPV